MWGPGICGTAAEMQILRFAKDDKVVVGAVRATRSA
jgi:hypothetical protein